MAKALVHGTRLHYEALGDPHHPPALLVSGLGEDHRAWAQQLDEYTKALLCVVFDNRGTGQSEPWTGPQTIPGMAQDAWGLVDCLGLEAVHLVGESMGGAIVQEMAVLHPERVRSLSLNATWPRTDPYLAACFTSWITMRCALSDADFYRAVMPWVFTPAFYADHGSALASSIETLLQSPPCSPETFVSQASACIHHDALERLSVVTAPTLITVGTEDILTPARHARALHAAIPGSRLVAIEARGHGINEENPEEFTRATLDWIMQEGV